VNIQCVKNLLVNLGKSCTSAL